MRHVVDSDEVAHLWMHKSQDWARNKQDNFRFNGSLIYSYGSHFPIAQHVENTEGAKAILLTTRGYSNTTSKHLGMVRRAIPDTATVFNVPLTARTVINCEIEREGHKLGTFVTDYRDRMKDLSEKTARARSHKAYLFGQLQLLVDEANQFCHFFSLPGTFYTEQSMEVLTEKVNAYVVEEKRKKAEAQKALESKHAEDIKRWLAGEINGVARGMARIYLRVEGREVVSSWGARFPVEHAAKALRLVRLVRETGRVYPLTEGDQVHKYRLGHYEVTSINTAGDVVAGCHKVLWQDIERIAGEVERLVSSEAREG